MATISPIHEAWAKLISDTIKQHETNDKNEKMLIKYYKQKTHNSVPSVLPPKAFGLHSLFKILISLKFPKWLPANLDKNLTPCAAFSFVTLCLLLVSNQTTVTMMLKWSRYPSKGPAHDTIPSSPFNSSLFSLSNSSLFSSPPLNSSLFSSPLLNSNPSSSSLSSSYLPPNSHSSSSNSSNGPF